MRESREAEIRSGAGLEWVRKAPGTGQGSGEEGGWDEPTDAGAKGMVYGLSGDRLDGSRKVGHLNYFRGVSWDFHDLDMSPLTPHSIKHAQYNIGNEVDEVDEDALVSKMAVYIASLNTRYVRLLPIS